MHGNHPRVEINQTEKIKQEYNDPVKGHVKRTEEFHNKDGKLETKVVETTEKDIRQEIREPVYAHERPPVHQEVRREVRHEPEHRMQYEPEHRMQYEPEHRTHYEPEHRVQHEQVRETVNPPVHVTGERLVRPPVRAPTDAHYEGEDLHRGEREVVIEAEHGHKKGFIEKVKDTLGLGHKDKHVEHHTGVDEFGRKVEVEKKVETKYE